jgi:hypothetical protein
MLARIQRKLTWHKVMDVSQWVIPLIAFYFIWLIIENKTQNSTFLVTWNLTFQSLNLILFFSGMLFLTFMNLFFESLKWQYSIEKIKEITLLESFLQTLKAMAAGFITPFRSGALVARFISNENSDKKKIIDSSIQMAIAQFAITFFAGLTGLAYWLMVNSKMYLLTLTLTTIFVFALIAIYVYRHPLKLNFFKMHWTGFRLDFKLVFYSLLRYLVFTIQYVIILRVFGVIIDLPIAFSLVSITFLVNSLLPSGILGKIGIRELSGILIIGETTGFIVEVSCAAFMIWILNQALPAILGSILFLSSNSRSN